MVQARMVFARIAPLPLPRRIPLFKRTHSSLINNISKALTADHLDSKTALKALSDCSTLEAQQKESPAPNSINTGQKLLERVLQKTTLTAPLLGQFFTLKPAPSARASIMAIDAFNQTNNAVPEKIAMIPFRRAVYECEFDEALEIMSKTTGGESNYRLTANKRMRKLFIGYGVCITGVLGALDMLLSSGLVGVWEQKGMILVMAATYLGALSVYGTLALSGAKAGVGDVIQWGQGVSVFHRLRHNAEFRMGGVIAEMNRSLPENQGECAVYLINKLKQRGMVPAEGPEEQMVKEYWARGGEGFEWVEPDQDPAEIRWSEKMEASRHLRLDSLYTRRDADNKVHDWREDLRNAADNKSVPHGSLIDLSSLRSYEQLDELEGKLKKGLDKNRPRGLL